MTSRSRCRPTSSRVAPRRRAGAAALRPVHRVLRGVRRHASSFDMDAARRRRRLGGPAGALPRRSTASRSAPKTSSSATRTIYSFEGVSNQNPAFSVDDDGAGRVPGRGQARRRRLRRRSLPARRAPSRSTATPSPSAASKPAPTTATARARDIDGEARHRAERERRAGRRQQRCCSAPDVTEQMWVNYYVDRGGMSAGAPAQRRHTAAGTKSTAASSARPKTRARCKSGPSSTTTAAAWSSRA